MVGERRCERQPAILDTDPRIDKENDRTFWCWEITNSQNKLQRQSEFDQFRLEREEGNNTEPFDESHPLEARKRKALEEEKPRLQSEVEMFCYLVKPQNNEAADANNRDATDENSDTPRRTSDAPSVLNSMDRSIWI
jgi:hypothetical protein